MLVMSSIFYVLIDDSRGLDDAFANVGRTAFPLSGVHFAPAYPLHAS